MTFFFNLITVNIYQFDFGYAIVFWSFLNNFGKTTSRIASTWGNSCSVFHVLAEKFEMDSYLEPTYAYLPHKFLSRVNNNFEKDYNAFLFTPVQCGQRFIYTVLSMTEIFEINRTKMNIEVYAPRAFQLLFFVIYKFLLSYVFALVISFLKLLNHIYQYHEKVHIGGLYTALCFQI